MTASVVRPLRPAAAWLAVAILAALLLGACGDKKPPAPGISVSATNLVTSEAGSVATFQIVLAAQPKDVVTLVVQSTDASEGLVRLQGVGSPSSFEFVDFTPADWNTPRTIEVQGQDDFVVDGNKTFSVLVAVAFTMDAGYATIPEIAVSVTNTDDEVPGITLSKATLATSEGATTDSFTVVLNTQPSATVTIPVTSNDTSEGLVRGGSSPGTSQPSVTLTFHTYDWNVAQTVTVYGQNDLVDDGNQTYTVDVGPAAGAAEYVALGLQQVSVTNADDDTGGLTILAGASPLVTSENGTTATFTVRLNTEPTADVVVPVASGNAAEGLLSAAGQGPAASVSLTFTPLDWNVPQTVTITGQDDLGAPVAGDDVAYSVDVGPPSGADPIYTALSAQAVPVLNTDNDVAAFSIPQAGGPPLATSESGSTATFTVGLNKAPATTVTIPVTVSDVTEGLVRSAAFPIAQQTVTLTFTTADWLNPQTVTVVGQPDAIVDGSQTYSITVGPPAGDAEYAALPAKTVSVTNADVNVAGFTVSTNSVSVWEAGAASSFTVKLNTQPAADVTVPVSSSKPAEGLLSGGDSGGSFVASLNLTFTPGNWQTPQTVQVKGPQDNIDDGTQTYAITVGPTASADPNYQGLAAKTVSGTTYDVDTAGYTVTPTSGLATTEAGATASFTVKLNTIPTGTVNVPVSVDDTSEALVSSGGGGPVGFLTLSFTAGNWSAPQTVTVTGVDDALLDGNRPFVVGVGPTQSGDPAYANLASKNVTGTNTDDEVGANEGALGAPVAVGAGVAYQGQVGAGGYSYYVVTGLTGGAFVSLTNPSDDVTLDVYDNGSYSTGKLCTSSTPGAFASESCMVTVPVGGAIYIRVSGVGTPRGAGFTLLAASMYVKTESPPLAIPEGTPTGVVSSLTVAGAPASLTKVVVRVNVTHTWDSDLSLYLISPQGTQIELTSGNGGSGDNYTGTVFDDAAATSITSGSAPFTGTFRPEQPLSGLVGQTGNGTWQLKAVDTVMADTGTIVSWGLVLQ